MINSLLAASLALATLSALAAPAQSPSVVSPEANAAPELEPHATLPTAGTTLPFSLENPGRLPIVRATVNGVAGDFLLDTGAMVTVLTPAFADQAGLTDRITQPGAKINGRGDGVRFAKITELKLGEARFDRFHALLLDLAHLKSGLNCDPAGILGANVLLGAPLTLDYPARQVTLNARPPARQSVLPSRFHNRSLFLLAQVDGKKLPLLLDTGASKSFLHAGDSTEPAIAAGEHDARLAGQVVREKILRLSVKSLEAGPLVISHPPFELSRTHRCLGTDFFISRVLYIDPTNATLALVEQATAPAPVATATPKP